MSNYIQLPMAIQIISDDPIDSRLLLSYEEMRAMDTDPNLPPMPEKYFAVCKDDGKMYLYNTDNSFDTTTGKYRVLEADASTEAIADKLPNALIAAMTKEGGAEEICNALFNSEHFETTVDNKIDLAVSLIQAIDGNGS